MKQITGSEVREAHGEDAGGAPRVPQGDEFEGDLVRDTKAYLDERARGMAPSLRLSNAWDRFFRFGSSVIRGSSQARGLSGGDRDDCEQEFWAAVVDQLRRSRYEPARAGLRTWLSALARNKSADAIRQRTRRRPLDLNETVINGLTARDADPAAVYELEEEQAMVHRALAALSQLVSDRSYQVLLLRSIEELDVSEVAVALKLTLEQVRYRHCRAKQELRRLVKTSEG
jgi:RNA polymerase sigma factor (sigma-70 family)